MNENKGGMPDFEDWWEDAKITPADKLNLRKVCTHWDATVGNNPKAANMDNMIIAAQEA